MTDKLTLAYLAGAMDSDGYFTIKRCTYHQRKVNGHYSASYTERIGLKQTDSLIPHLLQTMFGGCCFIEKKQGNCKDLWVFLCEHKKAVDAIHALYPFLKIKKDRAGLILKFSYWKHHKPARFLSFWYNIKHPDWRKEPMLTIPEAQIKLNYKQRTSVNMALSKGALLALPRERNGHNFTPCIPKGLVELMVHCRTKSKRRGPVMPPPLLKKFEFFWQAVREANKLGINGTPVYHRSSCFTPKN